MIELTVLGLLVGFFAGLLGIGGGGIMVPVLTGYFLQQGHDANQVVHMALATSLSCIVVNACISTFTHHKHQAILWPVVWRMAPFVALGSCLSALWALDLSSKTLAIIFTLFMLLIAIQLVVGFQAQGDQTHISQTRLSMGGLAIGFVSALLAIGGGSFTVPFLHWHQVTMQKCIATAAALGLPIALAATVTMMVQGNPLPNTSMALGYVYWPATLALTLGAVITTPMGARLTHRLPVPVLKRVFAALLLILALKMYLTLH